MKILWLPHAPLRSGRTREEHLIEWLAQRHEVHVISFHVHKPSCAWRYLTDFVSHKSKRDVRVEEIAFCRLPRAARFNGWLLNRIIRREIAAGGYDAFISSPAAYIHGWVDFPSLRRQVAIVCDYLDGGDWTDREDGGAPERDWISSADAVFSVSHALTEQAGRVNAQSFYLPNGVDLELYRNFRNTHSTEECKAALGIDPAALVVSIIGLTCSPSLYFVDATVELARRGTKIALLLVGDSSLIPAIRERAGSWAHILRIAGTVPYSDVLPYFLATDIGLNVVDDEPYFHRQSPLKIFEYGAMGKRVVVAPRLDEVERSHLSHVTFCEPNAQSLLDTLMALHAEITSPVSVNLEAFDWRLLTARLEEILEETLSRRGLAVLPADARRSEHA